MKQNHRIHCALSALILLASMGLSGCETRPEEPGQAETFLSSSSEAVRNIDLYKTTLDPDEVAEISDLTCYLYGKPGDLYHACDDVAVVTITGERQGLARGDFIFTQVTAETEHLLKGNLPASFQLVYQGGILPYQEWIDWQTEPTVREEQQEEFDESPQMRGIHYLRDSTNEAVTPGGKYLVFLTYSALDDVHIAPAGPGSVLPIGEDNRVYREDTQSYVDLEVLIEEMRNAPKVPTFAEHAEYVKTSGQAIIDFPEEEISPNGILDQSYLMDPDRDTDLERLYREADTVLVGTLEESGESVVRNEIIRTPAAVEPVTVLKGDVPAQIAYEGGRVSYEDWILGESNPEKQERMRRDFQLKEYEEKGVTAVQQEIDETVQEGKTYLFFLSYDKYQDLYVVRSGPHGMLEISEEDQLYREDTQETTDLDQLLTELETLPESPPEE